MDVASRTNAIKFGAKVIIRYSDVATVQSLGGTAGKGFPQVFP